MLCRIISGGQTGVDRGALDAALDVGFPCGGWCPAGRKAEDGVIPDKYPLQETRSGNYRRRTLCNVRDSDGTLILHIGPLKRGTRVTYEFCLREARPVLCVDARLYGPEAAAGLAREFILAHDVRILNVAGPRASHWPGAHAYAADVIRRLLPSTPGRPRAQRERPGGSVLRSCR